MAAKSTAVRTDLRVAGITRRRKPTRVGAPFEDMEGVGLCREWQGGVRKEAIQVISPKCACIYLNKKELHITCGR
jgi:hypothetical protein